MKQSDPRPTEMPDFLDHEADSWRMGTFQADATSIVMGFDAMRIAMGLKPQNFTYKQVMQWLRLMK